MSAKILDGKALAQDLKDSLRDEVAALKKQTGLVPRLVNVMVGSDHGACAYLGALPYGYASALLLLYDAACPEEDAVLDDGVSSEGDFGGEEAVASDFAVVGDIHVATDGVMIAYLAARSNRDVGLNDVADTYVRRGDYEGGWVYPVDPIRVKGDGPYEGSAEAGVSYAAYGFSVTERPLFKFISDGTSHTFLVWFLRFSVEEQDVVLSAKELYIAFSPFACPHHDETSHQISSARQSQT